MRYRRRRGLGGAKAAGGMVGLRRWSVLVGITGLLFAVGYVTSARWLFPAEGRGEEASLVQVPDLVGLTAGEAENLAQRLHLGYAVRAGVSHPSAPEGAVLAQSPFPGQFARPGAPISVTLSRGPEVHFLPDVVGMSSRQARIVLERLGLVVHTEEVRDLAEGGRTVGMRPEPGVELAVPSEVTILVSSGPPAMRVPDLLGLHVQDVLTVLEEAGLGLGRVRAEPRSFEAIGRVTGQYPPPAYRLGRGKLVEIRVSGSAEEIERLRSGHGDRTDRAGLSEDGANSPDLP